MSTTEPTVTPTDDSQANPTTPVSASSPPSTTPSQPAPTTTTEPQICPIDGKRLDEHGFCKRCGYQVPNR